MAQAPFRTAAITATGDITFGASGQLTVTAANGNLATSGSVQGATLTDGTFSTTAGAVTGVTTLTASGLVTANGADLSSGGIVNTGAIAGATTVSASGLITGGSLTDGTLTIDGSGNITGAVGITASGAVSGGSITDGTATLTAGGLTGLTGLTSVGAVNFSGAASVSIGAYSMPVVDGTAGYILKTDGAGTVSWAADTGSSPGGASGNIQFNDGAGGFAGDASLNWDTTNDVLELGNGGTTYAGLASNTQSVAGGATTAIDAFAQTSYVAAKYLITAENASSGEVHTQELLISADGTVTNFVPFADVFTGAGPLFTIAVSGTNPVSVDVTNLDGANALNVQFMRTTLA